MFKSLTIINQVFGPAFIDIANHYSEKGCSVTIITGRIEPVGCKLNPDIKVKRITKYNKSNILSRITSWLVFCLRVSFIRIKSSAVLYSTNPPMLIWFVGLLNKTRAFIYILDLYPDTLEGLFPGRSGQIGKLWRGLNRKSIVTAEKTFVVSESMSDQVFHDYGVRAEVLAPWSSLVVSEFPALSKTIITIVYAGNIGITHDFSSLLWLARHWRREETLCIRIIGEGFQKKRLVNELNLTKATIIESGYVNHDELKHILSKAHFGFLSTASGFESSSIPSKIYTYCGSGLPLIVSTSYNSLLREIVIENQLGMVVDGDNFDAFLTTIDDILESEKMMLMKRKNVRYAKRIREETLSKLP